MEAYYAEVRDSQMLTAEKERELFLAYRTCSKCKHVVAPLKKPHEKATPTCPKCGAKRNLYARDRVIEGALRFVLKVAREYARRAKGANFPADLFQSLVSAGNLGLMVAVDRFDVDKGTRFLTYAPWWIRLEIMSELDSMGLVRVPVYRQKALRLRRRQGEEVDDDAGCVTMEDLEEVDRNQSDAAFEDNLFNTYGADLIFRAMGEMKLRGRDRYIVLAYFGMREEPKNLRQISNRLDISSERVRQIKKDVLDQLRGHLEKQSVRVTDDVVTSS
jgi:RNA polymerase sigma factor (sigma-70 family)